MKTDGILADIWSLLLLPIVLVQTTTLKNLMCMADAMMMFVSRTHLDALVNKIELIIQSLEQQQTTAVTDINPASPLTHLTCH